MSDEKQKVDGKQPITVKLVHPFQYGPDKIEQIVLNPIKGKHLRKLSAQPTYNDLLTIASKCSGVSATVFDEMDATDCNRVVEAVGELL